MKLIINFFSVLLFILPTLSYSTSKDEIYLKRGMSFILPNHKGDIHISNGRVLKARNINNSTLIVALKIGNAIVTTKSKSYIFKVLPSRSFQNFKKVNDLTSNMKGLKTTIIDHKISILGELLRLEDWERISQLNIDDLNFLAEIHPQAKSKVNRYLTTILNEINVTPKKLILDKIPKVIFGQLSKEKQKLVNQIINPLGLQPIIDKESPAQEDVIEIQVHIMEVNRSTISKLGIDWPESTEVNLANPVHSPTFKSISSQIWLSKLKGEGKILANPTLLTENKKEVRFLAGGEFPVRSYGVSSSTVSWKPHGIMIKATPNSDSSNLLSLKIEIEVSLPDLSMAVNGIPGLSTNRISTQFNINQPRTIAISGLIRQDKGRTKKGIPLLMNIPLLGSLFSSHQFQNRETELLILVTPRKVKWSS